MDYRMNIWMVMLEYYNIIVQKVKLFLAKPRKRQLFTKLCKFDYVNSYAKYTVKFMHNHNMWCIQKRRLT